MECKPLSVEGERDRDAKTNRNPLSRLIVKNDASGPPPPTRPVERADSQRQQAESRWLRHDYKPDLPGEVLGTVRCIAARRPRPRHDSIGWQRSVGSAA